ncbi:MAG: AN1-type zinc finger domain-containing protein [Promethearchaeota archaeon]
MSTCKYCGNEIGKLPFKCRYCGNNFCSDHRLPENHECKFDFKGSSIDKILKPKVRKQINGTLLLFLVITVLSILTLFIPQYLCAIGFYTPIYYPILTIFTSLFIYGMINPIDLIYLFLLLILSYSIIRGFELKCGFKRLLLLYIRLSFYIWLINLMFLIFYFGNIIFYGMPIGFASGTIIAIISSSMALDPDFERKSPLLMKKTNIRIKNSTIVAILIVVHLLLKGLAVYFSERPSFFFIYNLSYFMIGYFVLDFVGFVLSWIYFTRNYSKFQ